MSFYWVFSSSTIHYSFRERGQTGNRNKDERSFRSATVVPTISNNMPPSTHAISGIPSKSINSTSRHGISGNSADTSRYVKLKFRSKILLSSIWGSNIDIKYFLLLLFRLMQNRARPRTLTRLRSKSGSPPTPKGMSPAATEDAGPWNLAEHGSASTS